MHILAQAFAMCAAPVQERGVCARNAPHSRPKAATNCPRRGAQHTLMHDSNKLRASVQPRPQT